jgi:tetratricopeptide (TPR) repeat protein
VKKCAKALSEEEDSEWRQAGAFLEGDAEMSMNEFNAAVSAYRRGFKENVRVEGAANAALSLGELESRSGEYDKADETLKEAVKLNVNSQNNRAKAYLLLARNAEGGGRLKDAEYYATYVINLFNYPELKKEAEKILENCGRKE